MSRGMVEAGRAAGAVPPCLPPVTAFHTLPRPIMVRGRPVLCDEAAARAEPRN